MEKKMEATLLGLGSLKGDIGLYRGHARIMKGL